MDTKQLRALVNAPGPVGPSSPIVAAALVALPRLLDVVEAAGEVVDADVGAMHFASEESCRRFNDAINGLRAAVAKWKEG